VYSTKSAELYDKSKQKIFLYTAVFHFLLMTQHLLVDLTNTRDRVNTSWRLL